MNARLFLGDIRKIEKEIKTCFVDSFAKIDKEFLEKARKDKPSWKDGTTVVVSVVANNTLYVANVGDSKVCTTSRLRPSSLLIDLLQKYSCVMHVVRLFSIEATNHQKL